VVYRLKRKCGSSALHASPKQLYPVKSKVVNAVKGVLLDACKENARRTI
jgi:hypothetical protein